MDLFEEIVKETFLISESISINSINDAISGMHPVWITYDDEKGGGGKARRLIYPVAYGLTSKGNPVIRAFQPQGSSKRGLTTPPNNREYPKWKYFRVDRIKLWRMIQSQTFTDKGMEGFNENGDDSMSIVYTIAPIGNAKLISKKKPEIGYKPITKQDVENIPSENEKPEETDQYKEQPKKYNASQIINNILNRIKSSNLGKGVQKIFGKKSSENIDNVETPSNFTKNNNLTATDTEPITKQDINQTQSYNSNNGNNNALEKPTDEPITKQDVNTSEEETVENNKLTNSYRDMMSRMNNLNK